MSQRHLITPRSIQVTPKVLKKSAFFMKQQGLDQIIQEGGDRVRASSKARSVRDGNVAALSGTGTYDTSSLTWAVAASVALFLLVVLLRNR